MRQNIMIQELPFETINRKILVKKKADTSDKYGCNPNHRTVEQLLELGIINIDKPKGPTSHQVSAYVQKIIGAKKGGHSGTLDPKVTGVLPVAIGKGTRVVQALLVAGKEYVCLMHLHKEVEKKKIHEAINSFIGTITQLPPLKSAVKRQERQRNIYYINVLEIIDKDVLFIVGCQAGTYIRKLCHDLGKKLGTGAHMAELRRSKAGPFNESTLATLSDLTDSFWYYKNEGHDKYLRQVVQPVEHAVAHLPKLYVMDTTVDAICHGADLAMPGISKLDSNIEPDQNVAIMTLKGELIALGKAKISGKEIMKRSKGIAIKTKKVFMVPGTYPRVQKKEN